ncbi:Retrovirus-related Pol polyprotein from transposon RE2 [Bienertia sinuspersici]
MITIESTNSLYIHPSDGINSVVVEKLQGNSNYLQWKRSLEIALASKRKLGFITGGMARDSSDKVKQEAWDTCNNMVISWIHNNVLDSIKKSILFMTNAHHIWKHLETRFQINNRWRKYQLNKMLYEAKQNERNVSDYYTEMKGIWEELDVLNTLPVIITTMTSEVTGFVRALNKQMEEQKLFQFLNGLNEVNTSVRSNVLMMASLPSVEVCSMIQQEETQRVVLKKVKEEPEPLAMYNKSNAVTCDACGKIGNKKKDCWTPMCDHCGKLGHLKKECYHVVGFLDSVERQAGGKGKDLGSGYRGGRWNIEGRFGRGGARESSKTAANVQIHGDSGINSSQNLSITPQQLEQMLKALPISSKGSSETEDDMDCNYAGMVMCNMVEQKTQGCWIIDSGATNHVTGSFEKLIDPVMVDSNKTISLPNGATTKILHKGDVRLKNGIWLRNVVYVPTFKHNLLSVKN